MKKIIILVAVLFTVSAQADVNFQKVYDHPGKAEKTIKAIQQATVLDWKMQDNTLKGTARVKCLISKKKFLLPAVYSTYRGDVVFEAKDDRFRVTYANMKFVPDSDLEKVMAGKKLSTAKKIDCTDAFNDLTLHILDKAKKYDNNW